MLVTGIPLPALPTGVPAQPAKRPQDGSAGATKRAAVDPEVKASLARAEDAADKSKTSRRDALASELTRLMSVARELNRAGGDLRSTADALQDIARQIAKVARELADAERALPAAQRRGTPPVAIPRAVAAAGPAAAGQTAAGSPEQPAAGEAEAPAQAAPADRPVGESRERNDRAGPVAGSPAGDAAVADPEADADDPLDPARRAEERRERARAGRSGTGELLKLAAGLLDEIRKTVRKAELFENLLDPEAARERARAGAEIEGYANDLRSLAAGFADPAQGLGIDVTA